MTRNLIMKSGINSTLYKLENNREYRQKTAANLEFLVGKVESPNYVETFITFRKKLESFKTEQFEVKGVYDLDLDSFLVFVKCIDYDVTVGGNGSNNLSKHLKLLYFKVNRVAKDSKVEMFTHLYNDLNEKNLLHDFYYQLEKSPS